MPCSFASMFGRTYIQNEKNGTGKGDIDKGREYKTG
jgi:hypothetical protein